ncbi:General transcriptional corepressor ssn6 [Beauveria bassiana]|uniref:Tetratricopeptide-like protein n=1 Tax=Beauveria bassiana (strain ARSEF 2860) TaxID=655819 RepID=J5JEH3_BEAB2|nr:tetratricopeptide-like protein [Beauveria bassiana ARSEF 2860]EJP62121.1 tetratricopeptide-like protein [Beauveria bassiana ARSEF 2860]KAF1738336.1 General transcriptional corepressor ssn6 [Beauveria bassiana]
MAANHHPSPTMMQMQHQQAQAQGGPPHAGPSSQYSASVQIQQLNEQVWLQIGSCAELLRTPDEALQAYERALIANPQSITALNAIGMLLKGREAFDKALEFFRTIVDMDRNNGEAWGNLGHCFLMTENLQKAYDAYQQALVNLRDPKDPMLWYGIGILYDRYGSYDYAEEAFSQVMQIQPDFEKANEIYFRLGIIYKQQSKYPQSLECFKYIVSSPPGPLTQEDIWFQIGHVHEQQKDFDNAKAAYQRVLDHTPTHAKVLQQLGWLHHQQSSSYEYQDRAIQYLEKSVNAGRTSTISSDRSTLTAADNTDAQSWYLLGRCYMSQQKYPKAYEAYQQAVYRDGKNPTFWCSIGVLYYQINQYRDALDAYSRAIRLNPYISEVWYDLGTLYESCNNQISDALDAYQRAAELDPHNPHIKNRLQLLRSGNGGAPPAAPQPADVHPQAYQAAGPQGPTGPQWGGSTAQPPTGGPPPAPQGAGENWARNLSNVNPPPQPPNPYESRGEPFRGGPAPPLQRPHSPQHDPRQPQPDHRQAPQPQQQPPYADRPGLARRASPPPSHAYAPTSQGRVANPNFSGSVPSVSALPSGGPNGPAPPPPNGTVPFRPTHSPRPDGREGHVPSPKPAYPGQAPPPLPPYAGQSEALQPASENGQTGPVPPLAAAPEAAVQRQEDRPPSVGPKRMREWEDDASVKKQANEENRARLEDVKHRRPSLSPKEGFRRPSPRGEERRVEEPRRVEESAPKNDYHPSEAAHHHPQHSVTGTQLPPMQASAPADATPEKAQPPVIPKEEPPETSIAPRASATSEPERAARKMDVDEDYDDAPEDDKKAATTNGSKAGSTTDEAKPSSPNSTGANGTTAAPAAATAKTE